MRHSLLLFLAALSAPLSLPAQPPMVADVHFHHLGAEATATSLASMDSLGVRLAVVIGTPAQLRSLPPRTGMQIIKSLTLPCIGGRMPNSGVTCYTDGGDWPSVDTVRALVREGQVQMLGEINAQYAGIRIDDARMEPYFALAEKLDIPVSIHLGVGPPGASYAASRFPPYKSPDYSGAAGDPMVLESVLKRHPRLRVVVAHAAWPMHDAMLYLLYMHPQLYVDVSVLQYAIPRAAYTSYLQDIVDAGFATRVLFGSDGNAHRVKEGVDAIGGMTFLTAEQRSAILWGNAQRFFQK
ncbi:MAG: amidohydrolase family protein [Gemmatimonadaceae bacterium]|nr:amidohydrolase family protein [Gemmatimonadaceae bacterium]